MRRESVEQTLFKGWARNYWLLTVGTSNPLHVMLWPVDSLIPHHPPHVVIIDQHVNHQSDPHLLLFLLSKSVSWACHHWSYQILQQNSRITLWISLRKSKHGSMSQQSLMLSGRRMMSIWVMSNWLISQYPFSYSVFTFHFPTLITQSIKCNLFADSTNKTSHYLSVWTTSWWRRVSSNWETDPQHYAKRFMLVESFATSLCMQTDTKDTLKRLNEQIPDCV